LEGREGSYAFKASSLRKLPNFNISGKCCGKCFFLTTSHCSTVWLYVLVI